MNRILLGQRLAFGFEGTCIPENFAALVREYKIGNVILLPGYEIFNHIPARRTITPVSPMRTAQCAGR